MVKLLSSLLIALLASKNHGIASYSLDGGGESLLSPVIAPANNHVPSDASEEVQVFIFSSNEEHPKYYHEDENNDEEGVTYGDVVHVKIIGNPNYEYKITEVALRSIVGPTNVDHSHDFTTGESSIEFEIPLSTFAYAKSKHVAATFTYEWRVKQAAIGVDGDIVNNSSNLGVVEAASATRSGKGGLRKRNNRRRSVEQVDDVWDHQEKVSTKIQLNALQWCLHCSFESEV